MTSSRDEIIKQLHNNIAVYLDAIRRLFTVPMFITVIIRDPKAVDGSRDVFMSSDPETETAIAAIRRLCNSVNPQPSKMKKVARLDVDDSELMVIDVVVKAAAALAIGAAENDKTPEGEARFLGIVHQSYSLQREALDEFIRVRGSDALTALLSRVNALSSAVMS